MWSSARTAKMCIRDSDRIGQRDDNAERHGAQHTAYSPFYRFFGAYHREMCIRDRAWSDPLPCQNIQGGIAPLSKTKSSRPHVRTAAVPEMGPVL